MNKTFKCLLMGFYNRCNIGDEVYKVVIPKLLPKSCEIVSVSCDDALSFIDSINEYDIVFIGGGDIVNDYFMSKVQQLLKTYTGRIYGVSVGIPFTSDCHYLHIFDNVIVRSRHDYEIASKEIGDRNVYYLPDFSVALREKEVHTLSRHVGDNSSKKISVGLCLAQPLFYNNPKKTILFDALCTAMKSFVNRSSRHIQFILLAFNSNVENNQECDHIINNQVARQLRKHKIDVIVRHDITDPKGMLNFFQTQLDMCLCMRFHSVMFSLISNVPFIPLYVSQKVQNLLDDIQYIENRRCHLPIDSKFRPTYIDDNHLLSCLEKTLSMVDNPDEAPYTFIDYSQAAQDINKHLEDIVVQQPYARLISRINATTFIDVLTRCKMALCKYLNIEPCDFQDVLHRVGQLTHEVKSPLDIARFLCYNITGQMHHPCVWGLADNLQKDNFKLYDALKYIYDETEDSNKKRGISYYPNIPDFQRKALINVDFVFSNDFTKYHRSGWSYVVGGLMNLDAPTMLKHSDVFIDTYVDRSFHWGKDIMTTLGEIPYTKQWIGFVHHTFDTTHSDNNCETLFEQDDFLVSLQTCQGLIALSSYLQRQLENRLHEKGIMNVPVYVLYHPMEFVDNMFTMENFIVNREKKLVQIGAWLRNPYALYQMELSSSGDFEINKVHLKGTEMDLYFAPQNLFSTIASAMDALSHHEASNVCRSGSVMCRPNHLRPCNKYCQGALDLITKNDKSVIILDKLSNHEYDMLLAENIVFLNLVDCSAVNTVIECIVRNTPLIVNRLPALEELLGNNYPGFYGNLHEASQMCVSIQKIQNIHEHMKALDKTRYKLSSFIKDFQDILCNKNISSTYSIKQNASQPTILPLQHYRMIHRFLPPRYQIHF